MSEGKPSRKGRDAILFDVTGPDSAAVLVAVEHRDAGDPVWSGAGSVAVLAPSMTALAVHHHNDEVRVRVVEDGDPRGPVKVRIVPPEWMSC